MNIKKKNDGFKKNIMIHSLLFHCNIIDYPLFAIDIVAVRWIPCSCPKCLRKISSLWNRIQDKYNQDQYKDDIQDCVHWSIL